MVAELERRVRACVLQRSREEEQVRFFVTIDVQLLSIFLCDNQGASSRRGFETKRPAI